MSALRKLISILLIAPWLMGASFAQENAPSDPHAEDRQALLTVFHEMEASINEQNVDRMVAQMTPDATVTWLNGEVSRGHDEIRAYYHRMVQGNNRILDKYTTTAKVGAPARFFGEVAVADGTMRDYFFPVARGPFELDSNWSASCVKTDAGWKVAALHLSSNVFTNSLIAEAKTAAWYTGAGGLVAGIVLTWLFGRLLRRGA